MFKKKSSASYSDRFKKDMSDIIDQLDLSEFQKRSMKSRWLDQLSWLSGKAKHSQKWYYRLRLTTIVGGVVIPALVSLNITDSKTRDYAIWFTFGISQMVAISAAIDEFFHYGDLRIQYRKTSEALKAEGWQFFQLAGPYNKVTSHSQAYVEFSTRVESIIQNDVQGFTELLKQKQEEEKQKAASAQKADTLLPGNYAPTFDPKNGAASNWQGPTPRSPNRQIAGDAIAQSSLEDLSGTFERGSLRAPGRPMADPIAENNEEDLSGSFERGSLRAPGRPMADPLAESDEEDLQVSLDTSSLSPPGRPIATEPMPERNADRSRPLGRGPGTPPDDAIAPNSVPDRYRERLRANN
ncbi:MAG TPA: DUF4231 domain-containing protein [Kamptonema sp.]|nr:DUF4231 domain-containing protein [Kamptonema sp.]